MEDEVVCLVWIALPTIRGCGTTAWESGLCIFQNVQYRWEPNCVDLDLSFLWLAGFAGPRGPWSSQEPEWSVSRLQWEVPRTRAMFSPGPLTYCRTSLVAQTVKCLPTIGRPRFDPWVGKIPWRRKWHPLQCSRLEDPTDGGACGLQSWLQSQSQTQLSDFTLSPWHTVEFVSFIVNPWYWLAHYLVAPHRSRRQIMKQFISLCCFLEVLIWHKWALKAQLGSSDPVLAFE